MSWQTNVSAVMRNWPEEKKRQCMAIISEENSLAESHGFKCTLDPRRGHGFCSFYKGPDNIWATDTGWVRATKRGKYHTKHRYFHTLLLALTDKEPRAYRDQYGKICKAEEGLTDESTSIET